MYYYIRIENAHGVEYEFKTKIRPKEDHYDAYDRLMDMITEEEVFEYTVLDQGLQVA